MTFLHFRQGARLTLWLGFPFALAVACAWGRDPNQPVKQEALEVSIGYGYAYVPGLYDSTGSYQSWGHAGLRIGDTVIQFPKGYAPASQNVPFRIKYGLGHGIDVSGEWTAEFANGDAGGQRGMRQPKLGIRYTGPRGGVFSNLTLPFATGDFGDPELYTKVEVGGLLRKRYTHWRYASRLSYENILARPTDNLRALFQPEILWTRRLSTYLGFEGIMTVDRELYLLLLNPGVRGDFSSALSWEVGGKFTVAGLNAPAGWDFKTTLFWTFKH